MRLAPHASPPLAESQSGQKSSYLSYALAGIKSAAYGVIAYGAMSAPDFAMDQKPEAKAAYSSPSAQPKEEISGIKEFQKSKRYVEAFEKIRTYIPSLKAGDFATREEATNNIMKELKELQRTVNPLPEEIRELLWPFDSNGKHKPELTSEQANRLERLLCALARGEMDEPERIAPMTASLEIILADLKKQTGFTVEMSDEMKAKMKAACMTIRPGENDWCSVLRRVCDETGMTIGFDDDATKLHLIPIAEAPDRTLILQGHLLGLMDAPDAERRQKLQVRQTPNKGMFITIGELEADESRLSEVSIAPRKIPNEWKFNSSGWMPRRSQVLLTQQQEQEELEELIDVPLPPMPMTDSEQPQQTSPVALQPRNIVTFNTTVAQQPQKTSLSIGGGESIRIGFQQIQCDTKKMDDGTHETILKNTICGEIPWPETPCEYDSQTYGAAEAGTFVFHNADGDTVQSIQEPQVTICERLMTVTFRHAHPPTTVEITAFTNFQVTPLSFDLNQARSLGNPEREGYNKAYGRNPAARHHRSDAYRGIGKRTSNAADAPRRPGTAQLGEGRGNE